MSDYMAQKAGEQIEAGLCERDLMLLKMDSLISEINTLTAKVKRYEEALNDIADQNISGSNVYDASELMVEVARAALKEVDEK